MCTALNDVPKPYFCHLDGNGRRADLNERPELRKGQVETLVLADDPGEDTLLVGNGPSELGVDQHDMDALGVHGEVVPADRALLAAAVAGSAAVVVVPRTAMPEEAPVAAVLRYTDASTTSAS